MLINKRKFSNVAIILHKIHRYNYDDDEDDDVSDEDELSILRFRATGSDRGTRPAGRDWTFAFALGRLLALALAFGRAWKICETCRT